MLPLLGPALCPQGTDASAGSRPRLMLFPRRENRLRDSREKRRRVGDEGTSDNRLPSGCLWSLVLRPLAHVGARELCTAHTHACCLWRFLERRSFPATVPSSAHRCARALPLPTENEAIWRVKRPPAECQTARSCQAMDARGA